MSRHFLRVCGVIALAATLSGARAAAAQVVPGATRVGDINGTVIDARTGAPIPAATVRLLEHGRSELSHPDGTFHFDDIAPGSYRIAVRRVGYAPVESVVTLTPTGAAAIRVELTPSAVSIPGLVVTGTGRERSAAEIYRPASVLDDAELRRRLSSSIAATLANEPGVSQRYNGPAASQPVIRGLSGDRILILEDGQRTGDIAATSGDHAVTIEPLTAERIEVLRGPAGLLYGSNALGGVINVIREEVPRSLPERVNGSVSSQLASVNQGVTAGGTAMAGVGPIALRAELSGRRAGETRTPLGNLPSTDVTGYNAGAGASWIASSGFAGVAVRDYSLEYGVPGSFNGEQIPGAHVDGVTIDLRRSVLRAEAGVFTPVGPFSTIEWDGQYIRFEQDEIERSGEVGTSFGQLTATSNLMAHHRHEAGRVLAEGTVGLWGLWQDHRVGGAAGSAPAEQISGAVLGFEEIALDPFRFQVGGRFDWTRITPLEPSSAILGPLRTRDFGAFSGSVATLLEPSEGVIFGASLSRAFRNPSIPELFSGGPHLADYSFNIGNPDLEPEYGLGVDLFARLRRPRLSGEVAVYRNVIDNYVYYAPTGELDPRLQRFPVYQARGDQAVLVGAEGQVEWEFLDRLVANATASLVEATRTRDDQPLPAIPPAHGVLGLRYDADRYFFTGGWEGAARQDRVDEFESATPAYGLWNAGAGLRWTLGSNFHTLTLQARNLTDNVWYDHLSRMRQVAPQPGRNVELLYRASF